jgi:hypothetical protein
MSPMSMQGMSLRRFGLVVTAALCGLAIAGAAQALEPQAVAAIAPSPIGDAVMVQRVYGGEDGASRLDMFALPRTDGQPGRSVQSRLYATDIEIGDSLPGVFVDWHGVSTPRLLVVLSGELEVGLGDGTTKILRKGDIVLAADTTGQGHTSRLIGTEPVRIMTIRLRAENTFEPKVNSCPPGMAKEACVAARLESAKK